MKVLICGDRSWTNRQPIYDLISRLKGYYGNKLAIIEGGASGADTIAKEGAESLGVCVIEVKANWRIFHKTAGPIRNRWMIDFCQPDLVVGFHSDTQASVGTADSLTYAREKGIETSLIGN